MQQKTKQKKIGEKGCRQENEKYMTSSKISIFLNEDNRLIAITLICICDEFYALAWEL